MKALIRTSKANKQQQGLNDNEDYSRNNSLDRHHRVGDQPTNN